jgi:hypothetical protein
MRILKSYEEALKETTECISKRTVIKHSKLKNPPPQIHGPWKQDIQSAENTLKYIFDMLHHNCYLLLVTENKGEILKLESSTTAPSFIPYLKKLNTTIKAKQRKTLLKTLKSKQWRVMQCIVKPYRESTTSVEYPRFIEGLQLPNGVYILNLTDAVLLREDGTEPWHMISSNSLNEYNFSSHIPILSCSGQKGYWDIPIPNYDDVRLVLGYTKLSEPQLDWTQKKDVAVFRGGPTGCGYTPDTNMRLKLAQMKSDLLDVGIVENKSGTLKFDPKEGLGMLQTKIPKVPKLDMMSDQSKYKYIIHIDGNVGAYRLLTSMLTGSLILRVESDYLHWIDHLLKDGAHYIKIKSDLSNLNETIDWCTQNDSKCRRIAEQSYKVATKILTKEYLQDYFTKLLFTI